MHTCRNIVSCSKAQCLSQETTLPNMLWYAPALVRSHVYTCICVTLHALFPCRKWSLFFWIVGNFTRKYTYLSTTLDYFGLFSSATWLPFLLLSSSNDLGKNDIDHNNPTKENKKLQPVDDFHTGHFFVYAVKVYMCLNEPHHTPVFVFWSCLFY